MCVHGAAPGGRRKGKRKAGAEAPACRVPRSEEAALGHRCGAVVTDHDVIEQEDMTRRMANDGVEKLLDVWRHEELV
jgi:hypothetical protein